MTPARPRAGVTGVTGATRFAVSALDLFATLPTAAAARVAQQLEIARFAGGDTVVCPQRGSRRVCFVLDGRVRVSHRSRHGNELVLVERGPGELVGLLDDANDARLGFHVQALTISDIAFVPCSVLARQLCAHPMLLERLFNLGFDASRALYARLAGAAADDAGSAATHTACAAAAADDDRISRELARLRTAGVVPATRGKS